MSLQQQIFDAAIQDGMPTVLSQLIVSQAQHETDNFTSNIFNSCNNCFGYTSTDSPCPANNDFQAYDTIQDSVHELTAWIKRRLSEGNFPALNTITTPDQYAQLLKDNSYYTDSETNYANGIANYFSQNLGLVAGVSLGAVILGIALFLLIFRKELHVYKKPKVKMI